MKQIFYFLRISIFCLLFSNLLYAQSNETKIVFTVDANASCKEKIELVVKEIKDVKSAVWDIETQKMTVVYNSEKISPIDIYARLAAYGYDNEFLKATPEAYKLLPVECKYRRNNTPTPDNK